MNHSMLLLAGGLYTLYIFGLGFLAGKYMGRPIRSKGENIEDI
jgi:hypothetical protein